MISEELNRGNKPRGVHPYIILGCGDESWPPPGPDSSPEGRPTPHTMEKKGGFTTWRSLRGEGGINGNPPIGPGQLGARNRPGFDNLESAKRSFL